MSKVHEILCLGMDPELWRLDDFSAASDLPATRITAITEAELVPPALLEAQRWDLILCDAAAYYDLRVDKLLKGLQERDASLVIARPPGSTLSPADAYRRGAADLVVSGDREHLLMVVARELANAADRKELRRLRVIAGGGREAAPLPKLTQFGSPSTARVEPIPMPAAPETEAERVQDMRIKRLIEGGGLTLEYQPIVTLNAMNAPQQEVALFEALMRLKDGSGRTLQPLEFFPAVARHRWFSKLDHWVFHRSLNILARMQASASGAAAGLFLNLAADTLSTATSLEPIVKLIHSAEIADGSLVIEVTKDVFHKYQEGLETLCAVLRARGHGLLIEKFTIEDCALLDEVPDLVSHVKINCALLDHDVGAEKVTEELMQMVRCAREHKIKTIALAVDKADLLPRLYTAGFDYIQGHFVSMPYEDLVYPSVHVVEI